MLLEQGRFTSIQFTSFRLANESGVASENIGEYKPGHWNAIKSTGSMKQGSLRTKSLISSLLACGSFHAHKAYILHHQRHQIRKCVIQPNTGPESSRGVFTSKTVVADRSAHWV